MDRRPPSPPNTAQDADQLPQHELARLLYAQRRQRNTPGQPKPAPEGKRKNKQDAKLEQLCRDVETLAREIETLTQSRDILVSRRLQRFDDLDGSSVKAVKEYFRVFQRGLILSPVDAIAFLGNIATEDIQINSFVGRSVLIDQWKTYSMCWDDFHLRLDRAIAMPLTDHEAIVKTTATLTTKISRLTLAIVFPHVLQSASLTRRLRSQTISGRIRLDFVYDRNTKQFARLVVSLGLVSSFAELLPNQTELAALFSRALLTDDFYIGEISATTTRTSDLAQGRGSPGNPRGHQVSAPDLEETKRAIPEGSRRDQMRLDHIL